MSKKTGNEELDKLKSSFDSFDAQCKELTLDNMNKAPLLETEPQLKLTPREKDKLPDHYLKPVKSINVNQKFNEKFREEWEFRKQYVQFEAENLECIGDVIEKWTRPYGGVPAEFWQVPVNVPVWGPRYLAEEIAECKYHRLVMKETSEAKNAIGSDGAATYFGKMVANSTVHRLNARPVSTQRSVFMGSY